MDRSRNSVFRLGESVYRLFVFVKPFTPVVIPSGLLATAVAPVATDITPAAMAVAPSATCIALVATDIPQMTIDMSPMSVAVALMPVGIVRLLMNIARVATDMAPMLVVIVQMLTSRTRMSADIARMSVGMDRCGGAAVSSFSTPTCSCMYQSDAKTGGFDAEMALARLTQEGFPSGQRWGAASLLLKASR